MKEDHKIAMMKLLAKQMELNKKFMTALQTNAPSSQLADILDEARKIIDEIAILQHPGTATSH